MNIKNIGKIIDGQDGAVWKNYLFRFDAAANCSVYDLNEAPNVHTVIGNFTLDKADIIKPHSNVVLFGNEYFSNDDEFPLLYTNIYNNYSSCEDKMKGVTCVYRLQKDGVKFSTTLVQIIEIGFTEDPVWRSLNTQDVRPYGNFAIDCENGIYYAFTMHDEENIARYFSFNLPKLCDGEYDEKYGVKRVVLGKKDIKDQFDCEYHRYIQGAGFNNGLLYSTEGFTNNEENPAVIRIIDPKSKIQKEKYELWDYDMKIEPELIDFENDICYYCDNFGNLYILEF